VFKRALLVVAVVAAIAAIAPAVAAAQGEIHPGVMTFTDGGQCTANFVFRDGGGTYIGQAAHCSGTGGATETNGCDSGSLPLGTPVEVDGATQPGTMVYNSWLAMQANGETNADACDYNDFALIKLAAADVGRVDPTVPFWGGPTSVAAAPTSTGADVYSYQNSSLRGGASQLSPKQGIVVANQGNGWSRNIYTATPGIPGDSGSGFLDGSGRAVGTLSTVTIAPTAGSNGIGDLSRELAYAQANGFSGLALVPGTQPFDPDITAQLPELLGL
jgi:hypothetical protein